MGEVHSRLQNQLEVEPHPAPKLSAPGNPSRNPGSLPFKPEKLVLWQLPTQNFLLEDGGIHEGHTQALACGSGLDWNK